MGVLFTSALLGVVYEYESEASDGAVSSSSIVIVPPKEPSVRMHAKFTGLADMSGLDFHDHVVELVVASSAKFTISFELFTRNTSPVAGST